MADEVAGAGAVAIAPGRNPPQRVRTAIRVERGLVSLRAEIDLHVLVASAPLSGEGQRPGTTVRVVISQFIRAVSRGGDAALGPVGHHEAAGADVAPPG